MQITHLSILELDSIFSDGHALLTLINCPTVLQTPNETTHSTMMSQHHLNGMKTILPASYLTLTLTK